jgi:hypothetical protein
VNVIFNLIHYKIPEEINLAINYLNAFSSDYFLHHIYKTNVKQGERHYYGIDERGETDYEVEAPFLPSIQGGGFEEDGGQVCEVGLGGDD